MKIALYTRVSTVDKGQNPAYQIKALLEMAARKELEPVLFSEEGISGAKESRPELNRLMQRLRKGEFYALAVWKLDRLGRSLPHLITILQECELHGVQFISLTESMDTSQPMGRLVFHIFGALAEYERSLIAERVKTGMEHAARMGTKSGKPIGRPRLLGDRTKGYSAVLEAARERSGEPGLVSHLAREFGVSRAWLYRHIVPQLKGSVL